MITFVFFLAIMTAGWAFFLTRNRKNPKRAYFFIFSSMAYFASVFISYTLLAGGPS